MLFRIIVQTKEGIFYNAEIFQTILGILMIILLYPYYAFTFVVFGRILHRYGWLGDNCGTTFEFVKMLTKWVIWRVSLSRFSFLGSNISEDIVGSCNWMFLFEAMENRRFGVSISIDSFVISNDGDWIKKLKILDWFVKYVIRSRNLSWTRCLYTMGETG